MGAGSSAALSFSPSYSSSSTVLTHKPKPLLTLNPTAFISQSLLRNRTNPTYFYKLFSNSSSTLLKCGEIDFAKAHVEHTSQSNIVQNMDPDLLQKIVYDALVWSSLHGLVVGGKSVQKSGTVPGLGMVHAPFALLPTSFPESHWQQASELTCIFNELVDRVSLDWSFLQEALSRTKKVDAFTSRLLDIHLKMLEIDKIEEIRLGLHRSDYMLDDHSKDLLQIELNTISSSFSGLGCLVSELHRVDSYEEEGDELEYHLDDETKHHINGEMDHHMDDKTKCHMDEGDYKTPLDYIYRVFFYPTPKNSIHNLPISSRNLLNHHDKHLGLNSAKVPRNTAVTQYADALAQAWKEFNNPRAVVMVVVQPEERNMYDQHWLSTSLNERHEVKSIRKTLADIDSEGDLLPDGTLVVGGEEVSVIYFRAGYAPTDYPSESEWRARLLMERSSSVKCPSISYHLAGTKKVQQELAKPNVLERFLENKEDITKIRKCFAGLWSLDDSNAVKNAIDRPELFVLKPQREGGGNNIYGDKLRETLLKLQDGSEEQAAYILMQGIFPLASPTFLVRQGICHQEQAISELGIYGAYLRNKEKVIMNEQCGYLVRTKVSSSNEGGVAAGFAVLDGLYLN